MKKFIAYILALTFGIIGFGLIGGNVYAQKTADPPESTTTEKCQGIKLNTNFPGIGNCINIKSGGDGTVDPTNAFPYMMRALTRIIVTIILVVCFILIIVAGIMRASDNPTGAKNLLKKVAITIILLGLTGVILKVVNPVFFS